MRYLILVAVVGLSPFLLAAKAAQAADPTANMTTVACDNGPAASGMPDPAAVAGFTRCVLNADFTQAGGAFGRVDKFLEGCGANGPRIFQAYYAYSPTQVPCNRVTIEQDGASQVLHLRYQPGDSVRPGYPPSPLELAYPTLNHGAAVQEGWPQPQGPNSESLPQEMYTEITFRSTRSSLGLGQGEGITWWQMGDAGGSGSVEIDFIEINPSNTLVWYNGTGMHEWGCDPHCAQTTPDIITYVDYTQYHKFGVLVTSDDRTTLAKCLFIDDALQGCQTLTPTYKAPAFPGRGDSLNHVVVWAGNYAPESRNPVDIYIRSMTIWECDSYLTATCPGSTLYNGAGMTYWR